MANDRADVLQVISSTDRRGAEVAAVQLGERLADRGLQVRTVALAPGPSGGLTVETLGATPLGPATLTALGLAARRARVVIAHGSKTLPASCIATVGGLVRPFVYRNIGDPYYWANTRRRRTQTSVLLSRAAAVVALTDETARRVSERYSVPAERISVIPQAVSTTDFLRRDEPGRLEARAALGIDASAKLAIVVGALSQEKDVANAILALTCLPVPWQLLIVGSGPEEGSLRRLAGGQGVTDRVRFLGQVEDPTSAMTAAEVLLLPSRTEGLPSVVIEAAMIGVPAVVTDVGFLREIVLDGVTGRVVPPGDPEAMAAAVLEAEPALGRYGQAANEHAVATFSLDRAAADWSKLVEELMGQGRRRRSTGRSRPWPRSDRSGRSDP
jgi:glycosyltransferase involved in cell wall biosynthesis